jgi:hypothetical protein
MISSVCFTMRFAMIFLPLFRPLRISELARRSTMGHCGGGGGVCSGGGGLRLLERKVGRSVGRSNQSTDAAQTYMP